MGSLADLERRLATASADEDRLTRRDAHRRRIAVARFHQESARALAGEPSALRRARLSIPMTQAALATLAGISRDTLRRAEAGDPRVSARTWNRLAVALSCGVRDIRP